MHKKPFKKISKYIMLGILCLLIVMPNGLIANLANADETAIPLLDSIEQVVMDATQSETESEPESESEIDSELESKDETTTGIEPEDGEESESVEEIEATEAEDFETEVDPATVLDSEASAIKELEERAVENTDAADTPSLPEKEQALPVTPAVTPEPAPATKTEVETKVEQTWPEVGDITFSPRDAKVGDTVTVTVKMKDGNAIEETVEEVVARLWAPNQNSWDFNSGQNIRLRYDADDQQWVGFLIVQETWKPGYWRAEIAARYSWEVYNDYPGDQDHSEYDYTYKDIQFAFNVLNTGDSTAPQAIELIASPNPVKAGQAVSFSATVKDVNNQSDIVYALLLLDFESRDYEAIRYYEESASIPLSYDATTGKWVGTYNVPGNVPDGTEVYYYMSVADRAGNTTNQYFYEENRYFVVENPHGDVVAPELKAVNSPEYEATFLVNEEIGTVNIPIVATVVDDKSGVKTVTAEVSYSYGGGGKGFALKSQETWDGDYKYYTTQLEYDSKSGRYVGSVDLTVADPAGYYSVIITAEDNNGNIETYYGTQFELENPDTDWLAPEILDFDVIGDPVKFGDVMKINAKVTDENPGGYSSGIHSVMARIYYNSADKWEDIELNLNPATGRYEGNYSIKENDVYVVVYVYAIDNAGNVSESNREVVEIYNLDDYLPPYIDFVKYPPATMYQGEVAHFETRLVDEGTGIHSATISLINILDMKNYYDGSSENIAVAKSLPLTFNSVLGVWETDWLIPTDSPTGLFFVNLTVFDNVGNKRDLLNDGELGNIPQTLVILPKPVTATPGDGTDTPKPTPTTTPPTTQVNEATVTTPPVNTAAKIIANLLPNTATNNFNILLAGLVLIAIGFTRLVFKRKEGK
ncbi:LPXTG cell wall anchor domain-containing protein [Bacillus marasmi]|uniref:LPXTG cell wall anchor domain-containing protein n=1 Tax=Bacillus marasmi TaxID=1926279 RepID=UPI0011C8832C|nr:LPXTG cell wall anchor domain-containing protein [Bacillus marasmi]